MRRPLSILIILIGAFHGASGQKTVITSSKFYQATKKASKPVKNPVRSVSTEELYENGVVRTTIVRTFEGIPAEASRLVVTEATGSTISTTETIEVDNWLYSRTNNGKWTKEPWYFRHPLTESFGETIQTRRFWKEYFPSDKLTVYHTLNGIEIGTSRYVREEEFYISTSGTLLKTVTVDRSPDGAMIIKLKTFAIRHDPSITIEAPTLYGDMID